MSRQRLSRRDMAEGGRGGHGRPRRGRHGRALAFAAGGAARSRRRRPAGHDAGSSHHDMWSRWVSWPRAASIPRSTSPISRGAGFAAAVRPGAPRVRAGRRRPRDRGRARRLLPGLDLQRPGAGPDVPLHRGRPLRVRFINGGGHPHTIHFHGIHPRRRWTASSSTEVAAGRTVRLRVRRRAVRPAPVPLPYRAARATSTGLYGAFIIDPHDGRARRPTSS